jgi:putative ABC transport system ATP-binding protein
MTLDRPDLGAAATLGRGIRVVPELRQGFGLTVLFALGGAAGRVVVPITVQQAVDHGLREGAVDISRIVVLAIVAATALLLATVCQRQAVARLGVRSEHALYGLRVRLFNHIHRLGLEDHAEERRGALVARVTSDIETLTQFFAWGGLAWLLDGALMLIVAGVMLAYNWVLACIAFVVSAPLFIVLRWVQRRLVAAYDAARGLNGDTMAQISEVVTGAHVVRSYGIGERSVLATRRVARRRADAQVRASRFAAFLFPSGEVFSVLTVAAVVSVGVVLGPASGLSAGALVGFVFLTYRFLEPIAEFTEILDQTQSAVAGFRRVLGVLDIPIGPPEPEHALALPAGALSVDLANVTFVYRARPGLDESDAPALLGVNAHIPAGQRVAVVGATGSGKSTLARILARFVEPTSGAVHLGGVDLRSVANSDLRARLMLVPQEPFLFDGTIESNLRFARPEATRREISNAFVSLHLDDWLFALADGLDTAVGERGERLSAGERQLVALVRAYLADPDLLVLDEATSAVDPLTEVRIGRALERLAAGRTTIAIAHRLSTAARAERVMVLDRGVLVEDGTHEALLDRGGVYSALYAHWLDATATGP